jgi:hypothetical protein
MSTSSFKKEFRRANEQHGKDRNAWASHIGHTVLIFSEIEHLALLLIESAAPALRDFGATLLLDKRLDLLQHILSDFELIDQTLKTKLVSSLNNARKLAVKRNLIVHNPVLLTFTPDAATGKLMGEGQISSVRNENLNMNLLGMVDFLGEAESCRAKISDLYSQTATKMFAATRVSPKRIRKSAKVQLDGNGE